MSEKQTVEIIKNELENAKSILVASHIGPDADALCSMLLLGSTLKLNYKDKKIKLGLEESAKGLQHLPGYELIRFSDLAELLKVQKPDLLILTDSDNLWRISRHSADKAADYCKQNSIPIIAIDHHERTDLTPLRALYNLKSPAATQDVYELCYEELGLNKPEGFVELTMTGILSDTHRFKYQNPRHRQTFKIVSDLIEQGSNIEAIENKLNRFSKVQIRLIGLLATRISSYKDWTFSYLSYDDLKHMNPEDTTQVKLAANHFVSAYCRNIDDRLRGFIVYPDNAQGDDWYSVSFRAENTTTDVSVIARRLGGGGHKPAAGAKLKAKNINEAVESVKKALS